MKRHVQAIFFLAQPNKDGVQQRPLFSVKELLCILRGHSLRFRISFGFRQVSKVAHLQRKSVGGRLNHLDRVSVDRVESRSPDFVAAKDLNHTTFKHLPIKCPSPVDSDRLIVNGSAACHL
jgi:hypothetical protein